MTGAVSNTGFPVLEALGDLVLRGAEGLNRLALLADNKEGLVSVLQSLFLVGESAYEDGPGKVFTIRGRSQLTGSLRSCDLRRSILP